FGARALRGCEPGCGTTLQNCHVVPDLCFFQAEGCIRDWSVTGVQTCALPIYYATEFVGYYGWLSIPLPPWLVKAYLGLLMVTALAGGTHARITLNDRLVCAGIVAGSVASIFMLLWVFEMKQSYLATEIIRLGRGVSPGVQGRYFIPIAPILLMAISNTRLRLPSIAVVGAW